MMYMTSHLRIQAGEVLVEPPSGIVVGPMLDARDRPLDGSPPKPDVSNVFHIVDRPAVGLEWESWLTMLQRQRSEELHDKPG